MSSSIPSMTFVIFPAVAVSTQALIRDDCRRIAEVEPGDPRIEVVGDRVEECLVEREGIAIPDRVGDAHVDRRIQLEEELDQVSIGIVDDATGRCARCAAPRAYPRKSRHRHR